MKKFWAILMALCMMLTLCSVTAFAASEEESSGVSVDLLGTISSPVTQSSGLLYVKADKSAGLDSKVKVDVDLTKCIGTLYLPGQADASKLNLSWNSKKVTVKKNGKELESGSAPVAAAGKSVTYTIKTSSKTYAMVIRTVQGSKDIKPMFLNLDESLGTIDAMNSDDDHETSCYGKASYNGVNAAISMKGRGNSTWDFTKKPYNITFYKDSKFDDTKKVSLLKGVKSKKWSLVSNYFDNSLMRNKIAQDLGSSLGIGLAAEFVDVYMNGEYLGNYTLTPKNDYNAPDGGYALENDNYPEDEDQFALPGMFEIGNVPGVSLLGDGYHNRISIKDIGKEAKVNGVNNKKIEKYFLKAWNALEDYDSEEYQQYFDLDSWAKMFLMYEMSKTYDCYAGSLLMHRDGLTKSDKLIAGPTWDYDVSFGRTLHKFFVGVSEPVQVTAEGWFNDSIGIMAMDEPVSLLQELERHGSFMKAVSKVYTENRSKFEAVEANVATQAARLRDSALMNNTKWGTHSLCAEYVIAPNTMAAIGTGNYKLNYKVTTTWDDYIYNLGEYCNKRALWLTDHLDQNSNDHLTIVTAHGGTVHVK